MSNPKLHIYGPSIWHDHSFIVGNKEALQYLRDAIDSALAEGNGKATAFTADGEGFDLCVYQEEPEAFWDNLCVPYTDDLAMERRNGTTSPWDLFKKYKR